MKIPLALTLIIVLIFACGYSSDQQNIVKNKAVAKTVLQDTLPLKIEDFNYQTILVSQPFNRKNNELKPISAVLNKAWEKKLKFGLSNDSKDKTTIRPVMVSSGIIIPPDSENRFFKLNGDEIKYGNRELANYNLDSFLIKKNYDQVQMVNIFQDKVEEEYFGRFRFRYPIILSDDFVLWDIDKQGNVILKHQQNEIKISNLEGFKSAFAKGKYVIKGEMLYYCTSNFLVAHDIRANKTLWELEVSVSNIFLKGLDVLLVNNNELYCLDVRKKEHPQILWSIKGAGSVKDMIHEKNILYLQSDILLAFDIIARQIIWKSELEELSVYKPGNMSIIGDFLLTKTIEEEPFDLVLNKKNGQLICFIESCCNFSETGIQNKIVATKDSGRTIILYETKE